MIPIHKVDDICKTPKTGIGKKGNVWKSKAKRNWRLGQCYNNTGNNLKNWKGRRWHETAMVNQYSLVNVVDCRDTSNWSKLQFCWSQRHPQTAILHRNKESYCYQFLPFLLFGSLDICTLFGHFFALEKLQNPLFSLCFEPKWWISGVPLRQMRKFLDFFLEYFWPKPCSAKYRTLSESFPAKPPNCRGVGRRPVRGLRPAAGAALGGEGQSMHKTYEHP